MKLIHTSDLQIGKVFSFFNHGVEALLQDARQTVIRRIGEVAMKHGVTDVLVAGDVYDKQQLLGVTLNKPIESMRQYPKVRWHLMPGNHDHHRENGLWTRLAAANLPENIRFYLEPAPVLMCEDDFPVYVLPAPLKYISSTNDLTAYMDSAATPEGTVRIGMAHGSIRGFGSEGEASNLIDPVRATSAGLAYLALGDWHRQQSINERTWYSGTPEPDQFKGDPKSPSTRCNGGSALLVEINGPRAEPMVTPISTGLYVWHKVERTLAEDTQIDGFEADLRSIEPNLSQTVVDLTVRGTLSLAGHKAFEERIRQSFGAAVAGMRLDDENLLPTPTERDLDEIDRAGFVRVAADRLRAMSGDASDPSRARLASLALNRLYLEHVRTGSAA